MPSTAGFSVRTERSDRGAFEATDAEPEPEIATNQTNLKKQVRFWSIIEFPKKIAKEQKKSIWGAGATIAIPILLLSRLGLSLKKNYSRPHYPGMGGQISDISLALILYCNNSPTFRFFFLTGCRDHSIEQRNKRMNELW